MNDYQTADSSSAPKRKRPFHRVVSAVEFSFKSLFFKCSACGSCLLSQTRLICPMCCPKGLRNGPCGGTLDGRCEVEPGKPCVWMRIRGREEIARPPFSVRAPADPGLFGSSSVLNLVDKTDLRTRVPLSIPIWAEPSAPQTNSSLEKKLIEERGVVTLELQSPRTEAGLGRVARRVKALRHWVDAFNATSHAGGHRSISSLDTARVVVRSGGEAVVQVCGRDVTPAEFLDELVAAAEAGIANLLCLTGDWPADASPGGASAAEVRSRFFPMDSSQMILEARHLSEKGTSLFADLGERYAPAFLVGAAANPFSSPVEAAAARIVQKSFCGARFIQTQVVFDVDRFIIWRDRLRIYSGGNRLAILASIPVVGSSRALDIIRTIPGVFIPALLGERLRQAVNIREAGLELADHLMQQLVRRNAVDGFHLVPFGAGDDVVSRVVRNARGHLERRGSGSTVCHL